MLALIAGLSLGATWIAVATAESPLHADAPIQPMIVPVTSTELVQRFGVGVAVENVEGQGVVSRLEGTLTGLEVQVGDIIEPGDVMFRIDDRGVVAMVSDAPLWRDLVSGMRGEDVARLQVFLQTLGLDLENADGVFGPATARAVKEFNRLYGWADAGERFRLGSVAWIGDESLQVTELPIRTGMAVAPDSVVVGGPAVAESVSVSEPPGGISGGFDYRIEVGGFATDYEAGSGVISDPEAVARIAEQLGTSGEGAGTVLRMSPDLVLSVPASAVVVDGTGAACIFPDAESGPIGVQVLGGTLATAQLAPDPELTEVLVNPLQVREEPLCS